MIILHSKEELISARVYLTLLRGGARLAVRALQSPPKQGFDVDPCGD
jgi:hypothetical protein